jgi:hypothetical protein
MVAEMVVDFPSAVGQVVDATQLAQREMGDNEQCLVMPAVASTRSQTGR